MLTSLRFRRTPVTDVPPSLFLAVQYSDMDESERRIEVLKRLPHLTKLDGKPVDQDELDAAQA